MMSKSKPDFIAKATAMTGSFLFCASPALRLALKVIPEIRMKTADKNIRLFWYVYLKLNRLLLVNHNQNFIRVSCFREFAFSRWTQDTDQLIAKQRSAIDSFIFQYSICEHLEIVFWVLENYSTYAKMIIPLVLFVSVISVIVAEEVRQVDNV